ncbi:WD40-repeat-containing domain protein [Elsinoe ampelina]|uniref:WD40-repeat-containing domain protein n=1 Tax=Elsinoe ampelina TaxID=302913 RepID=A0A6A6G5M5_9PEZI|nr:WD40-repeat-containing domain protein [Elsinoe ampelina]
MEPIIPPYSTAGQFAYAPATQQTTVVTTTTTTVNLAPFVLQPPKHLNERDPKQYPLAYSPTPEYMKNIRFQLGGRLTTFTEAEEPGSFLGKYEQQQQLIKNNNGIVKELEYTSPVEDPGQTSKTRASAMTRSGRLRLDGSKATPTPPSLAAAAELAESQRRKGKRRSHMMASQGTDDELQGPTRKLRQSNAASDDRVPPFTPNTDAGSAHKMPGKSQASLDSTQATASDSQDSRSLRAPSSLRRTSSRRRQQEQDAGPSATIGLVAATPPIMDSDVEGDAPTSQPIDHQPNLPSMLNLSSQQDASLPSPSLSPVTAAANMRNRQLLSRRHTENDDVSDMSGLENEPTVKRKLPPMFDAEPQKSMISTGLGIDDSLSTLDSTASKQPTLMDVPEMISMFDSLPTELQSYVMFQLLKRSNKQTLRTVAEVVGPALKCDPFDTLPVELSLKITKHLDAVTLARAAQVSKHWRHLVNSDETTWKELIEQEGFDLSDGEIERAVRQGWGWQFPTQSEYERDLSGRRSSRSSTKNAEAEQAKSNETDEETSSTVRNTRKRKASAPSTSAKRQKRKASTPHDDEVRWMRELQKGQGPIAYASAAAAAVPDPKVGLASLKSLHLFKSIYQRHHMMRQTWMKGDTEPHHLAFRAHHRHVVTCLIFFNDRIITGSDDTSINIFDLRTGILRKRLEGHEGGVWALSCDGDTLVSGSTDRSVRVWNMTTGQCMQTFQGHTSTVRCLVILKPTKTGEDADGNAIMHPSEPVIITGSRDSTLRVWKLPKPDSPQMHQAGPPENESDNQYALRTLNGHHNSVRAIAAHGDTLVSGSYDCRVYVWKISTGELVHRLQGHSQKVYSVVLDHERNRCISGSMDNLVKVWSLDTGSCLFTLEGHTSLVGLLELSHGNLVSAAADSTLRVWDPDTGHCRSTLSAHTGAITCFQHDGAKVISGSDRTLKMWDIKTGECVRDLLTDLSGVWQVRFDERRCVAAVQRNNLTYIEVLDFGASRDGVPAADRGRRIVVDSRGREMTDDDTVVVEVAPVAQP